MSNEIGLSAYQQGMVDGGAEYFAKKRQAAVQEAAAQKQQTSEEQGFFGDMVDAAQMGLANAGAGMAETGYQLTGLSTLGDASAALNRVAKDQIDQMSPSGREAMQAQFFQDDQDGNAVFGDAWTNPEAMALQLTSTVAQVVPQVLAGFGIGGAAAKIGGGILAKAGTRLAVSRGLTGQAAVEAGVGFASKAASTAGLAISGAAVSGGMLGNDTRDTVMGMTDTELDDSNEFRRIYWDLSAANPDMGVDHLRDTAKKTLADRTATAVQSDPRMIMTNLVGEAVAGRYIDKLLKGVGTGNRLSNAAQQFIAQGATEALQGGIEQNAQNRALISEGAQENLDPMSGVLTNALNEGVLGGAMGGLAGAISKGEPRSPVHSPQGFQPGVEPAGTQPGAAPAGTQPGVEPAGTQPGVAPAGGQSPAQRLNLNERKYQAEEAKRKRQQYQGLDTDIRVADKLGFTDESVKLKAARKNYELAQEFLDEGDVKAAERFRERGHKIYREVMEASKQADAFSGQFPVLYDPANAVSGGDVVPAGDSPRSGGSVFDQQPTPGGMPGAVQDRIPQSFQHRLETGNPDTPWVMGQDTTERDAARANTEEAFTEQQGFQPGTSRDFPVSGELVGGEVGPANAESDSVGETFDGSVMRQALPGPATKRLGVRSDYGDSPDAVDWVAPGRPTEQPPELSLAPIDHDQPIQYRTPDRTEELSDRVTDQIRDHKLPDGLKDGRLLRSDYRTWLKGMADELQFNGGISKRLNANGDPAGNTPSLNPDWFKSLPSGDKAIGVGGFQRAVDKALAGEGLSQSEAGAVKVMLDAIGRERSAQVDFSKEQRNQRRKLKQFIRGQIPPKELFGELGYLPEPVTDHPEYDDIPLDDIDESSYSVDGIGDVGKELSQDIRNALEVGVPEPVVTRLLSDYVDNPVQIASELEHLTWEAISGKRDQTEESPSRSAEGDAAGRGMENQPAEADFLQSYDQRDLDKLNEQDAEVGEQNPDGGQSEEFVLAGSGRAADQTEARGQKSLLDNHPPELQSETTNETPAQAGVSASGDTEQHLPIRNRAGLPFKSIGAARAQLRTNTGYGVLKTTDGFELRWLDVDPLARAENAVFHIIESHGDIESVVHRDDIGDIDFIWGSEGGAPTPSGKRKGAKGIAHILEARIRKDGLSSDEARAVAIEVARTVVDGEVMSEVTQGNSKNVRIGSGDFTAVLSKTGDDNAWLLTGWENNKGGSSSEAGKGYDKTSPTHPKPTLSRPRMAEPSDDTTPADQTDSSIGGDATKPIADTPEVAKLKKEIKQLEDKRGKMNERQMERYRDGSATRARTTTHNAETSRINERLQSLRSTLKEKTAKPKTDQESAQTDPTPQDPDNAAAKQEFNFSAVVRDKDGNPYHVNSRRGSSANLAPFKDGKPQINSSNPTVELSDYTFDDEWWSGDTLTIDKGKTDLSYPVKFAEEAYSHSVRNAKGVAQSAERSYIDAVRAQREDAELLAKTEQQRIAMAKELKAFQKEYLEQDRKVLNARSGVTSAFVAGSSKFNNKQASSRGNALDKAQESFDRWLKAQDGRVKQAVLDARNNGQLAQAEKELADKGAKKAEDRKNSLRKILNMKPGDPVMGSKEFTFVRLNKDGKGYPKTFTFEGAGIVKGDDKVDIVKTVYQGGYEALKADYDAIKSESADAAGAVPAQTETGNDQALASTESALDHVENTLTAVRNGEATHEQYKAAYRRVVDDRAGILDALNAMTKDQLLTSQGPYFAGIHRSDKKGDLVQLVYEDMVSAFALGRDHGPNSYFMTAGGLQNYKAQKASALAELVATTTQDELKAYADQIAARRQEYVDRRIAEKKALENPESLSDYRKLLRTHMGEDKTQHEAYLELTPEQRIRYDELSAEDSRERRDLKKRELNAKVVAAGQDVGGSIQQTKHTKTGEDLFVVVPEQRAERDVYNQWNATAKRMGGWYSKFRGSGAIPGFQFKTQADAEAFLKYLGGDADAAQGQVDSNRDAFQDDRSQTAVQRLNEMADRLAERADIQLNADRKTNTDRRARMAGAAIKAAENDKALAGTMRAIAASIDSGAAKFLDAVRAKTQVEELGRFVRAAKDNELRTKYPSWYEREKHDGEPASVETVDHAEFPAYVAYRSDLASLARKMMEVDGLKNLGQKLMGVADDVSDAYLAFARDNLDQVSRFNVQRSDGETRAVFKNRADAEKAISHSGLAGKAMVLPIKRGENLIILSPSEAMSRGVWKGDNDKRITLSGEAGDELVKAIGRRTRNGGSIEVPWQLQTAHDRRKALAKMGIETPSEFRSALREFVALQKAPERNKIRDMELAMTGKAAAKDGLDFFPTPQAVADQMIEAAELSESMRVLEPSAGMGHIADRVRETGVEPNVVEFSSDRRELLKAKGYEVVANDFMDVSDGGYDRIIMNPPFSNRRDAEHVQHAYDLLKPGGRIVAIMGEGVFFGSDKKATAFREWLDAVGGSSEKLPPGSFMDSGLPVNTSVNARMVVINKPDNSTSTTNFSRSPDQGGLASLSDQIAELLRGMAADPGSLNTQATAAEIDQVKSWVTGVESELGLRIHVVPQRSDIPRAVRDRIPTAMLLKRFTALYDRETGETWMLAGEVLDQEHAVKVALHEAFGHGAFIDLLKKQEANGGREVNDVLDDIYRAAGRKLIERDIQRYELDFSNADERRTAVLEYVAHVAETGRRAGMVQRFVGAVKALLRRVWPTLAWTDTDTLAMLAKAKRNAIAQRNAGKVDTKEEGDGSSSPLMRLSDELAADDSLTEQQRQALNKIGPKTTAESAADRFREVTDRWRLKLRQGTVDRFAALMEMDKQLLDGDVTSQENIQRSSWVRARMSNVASGAVSALMNTGRIFLNSEGVIDVRKESQGLVYSLAKLGSSGEVERFMGWIAGNRAAVLQEQGRENLFSDDDIAALKVLNTGKLADGRDRSSVYSQVFDEFQQHRDDVLTIADKAGLLKKGMSEEQALLAIADQNAAFAGLAKRYRKAVKRMNQAADDADEQDIAAEAAGKVFDELYNALEVGVDDFAQQYQDLMTDQKDLWANEFYVPFYRMNEGADNKPNGPVVMGGLSRQQAYKKLKGGTQNLNDLLQNTIMNFHHLVDASMKNLAAQQALHTAQELGIADVTSEYSKDKNASTYVLKDGFQRWYNISDPLVYQALMSMSHTGMNGFAMKIMRGFKRTFTNLTTSTPQFIIANLIRDSMSAVATTDLKGNPVGNVWSGAKAFGVLDRHGYDRARLMASGGAFSFGHVYGEDAESIRLQIGGQLRRAGVVRSGKSMLKLLQAGWDRWQDINATAENANRMAAFKQAEESGKGSLYAAFQARDLMDFSGMGAWPATRFLIDTVPFLNARIQGLDKLYRSGVKPTAKVVMNMLGAGGDVSVTDKQAAARFSTVVGALTLATMALYLHNKDDDDYRATEDWVKDTYWWVRAGDSAYLVPKPFEVGAIATMAERLLEQAVDDEATGELFAERLASMFLQTFSFSPIPQILGPALDVAANKDSFTGRDIESMAHQRLSPQYRVTGSTTAVASMASTGMQSVLGIDYALSPVQVDFLIGGYLGQVGVMGAGLLDAAVRGMTGEQTPTKKLYEHQPIRRFYRDLNAPDPDKYTTLFYDSLRKAQQLNADIRAMREDGQFSEADELASENAGLMSSRIKLERVNRRLAALNAQIRQVERSELDGDEKRRRIDLLKVRRKQLVKNMIPSLE